MSDTPDAELLQRFARNQSEGAFAELVERHLGLVYSTAFRKTDNPQQAEDVTQAVFIILARKANSLGPKTVLPGWLYHTARLTAANFQRAEHRRIHREQEAFMESTTKESAPDALWHELSPLLEDAMAGLGTSDRDAIVLRYFQNRSLADIGATLGIAERAAQKRVYRALEKLRKFFAKRGVVSTTVVIAGVISAHSVQAAPVGLAQTVTALGLAKGATASASTLTLIKGALKIMAWTKAKMAIVTGAAVLLAVGGGTAIYETQQNPATDAPVELKVKWKVGKKYELHSELDRSAITKLSGQSQPAEHLKWTQDFNVSTLKALTNGGWQLELEFVNQAEEVSQAGHNVMSYDTAQSRAGDKQNPLAILGALIGARLEYFIDAEGKVQSVDGMDQLTAHIAAVGTPDQRQLFYQSFGADLLKEDLSTGDWMPNRIINVGESWSVKKDANDPIGIVTGNMKYTFKNWEQYGDHRCAHIEGTGDVSTKSVSTASGTMVEIKKGTMTEEYWFDPELGMIAAGHYNDDCIFKVTTRTQTGTIEQHDKTQWTLTEAQ